MRRGRRALIVSASMGAGHDGAARELAERLRARGWRVEVRDFLSALPLRIGVALRWIYGVQLRYLPASYDVLYHRLMRSRHTNQWVSLLAVRLAGRRLATWTGGADLIVSTYPLASQALGRMRSAGRLRGPVITCLTDFSVHPLWVSPGVDLHLVLHEVTAAQVRSLQPGARISLYRPLVSEAFRNGRADDRRAELRRAFGFGQDRPVALVVAGSWGVGEITTTVRELSQCGGFGVIVACGRNERLRAALADQPGVVALGWTEDMSGLMAASDVLVQNAGGLSSLEGMASGLPLVSYRCLPGHGITNADAMARAGVAVHGCGRPLGDVVRQVVSEGYPAPPPRLLGHADPADLIHDLPTLPPRLPVPRQRVAGRSWQLAAGVAGLVAVSWTATSGVSLAATHGIGVAHPPRGAVAVVVQVDPAALQGPVLKTLRSLDAAVAMSDRGAVQAAPVLSRAGLQVVLPRPERVPVGLAPIVARDREGRQLVLLGVGTDAVQLARTYLSSTDGLVPRTILGPTGRCRLTPGGVVVVAGRGLDGPALSRLLGRLTGLLHQRGLAPRPMSSLPGAW